MAAKVDWGHWDERLQKTFQKYNKKFGSSLELMNRKAFKHFTGNMRFRYANEGYRHRAFQKYAKGNEGDGVLEYESLKAALEDLFQCEKEHTAAPKKECINTNEIGSIAKPLLDEVIKTPVGMSWIPHILLKSLRDDDHGVTCKIFDTTAATFKSIASSAISDLKDIGTGIAWVGPVINILTEVWKHVKAYNEIDKAISEFTALLSYVTDGVVYINENDLYENQNTRKRFDALRDILRESESALIGVETEVGTKSKKVICAKSSIVKLEDLGKKLNEWLSSLEFMQSAESHKKIKDMHADQRKHGIKIHEIQTEQRKHGKMLEHIVDRVDNLEVSPPPDKSVHPPLRLAQEVQDKPSGYGQQAEGEPILATNEKELSHMIPLADSTSCQTERVAAGSTIPSAAPSETPIRSLTPTAPPESLLIHALKEDAQVEGSGDPCANNTEQALDSGQASVRFRDGNNRKIFENLSSQQRSSPEEEARGNIVGADQSQIPYNGGDGGSETQLDETGHVSGTGTGDENDMAMPTEGAVGPSTSNEVVTPNATVPGEYDYDIVLCDPLDNPEIYPKVKKFHEELESMEIENGRKIRVKRFYEIGKDDVEAVIEAHKKCRFCFILLSDKPILERTPENYIVTKSINYAIREKEKYWNVVPVFMVENHVVPFALNGTGGICYSEENSYWKESVQHLLAKPKK